MTVATAATASIAVRAVDRATIYLNRSGNSSNITRVLYSNLRTLRYVGLRLGRSLVSAGSRIEVKARQTSFDMRKLLMRQLNWLIVDQIRVEIRPFASSLWTIKRNRTI